MKEKLLAAHRGGIRKVLIPKDNAKDLPDIPDKVKKGLEIVPVNTIEEVLTHALIRIPEPIQEDSGKIEPISSETAENKGSDAIRH